VKLTRSRADDPVLITAAEPSLQEQFVARRRKYVIMMSTRVVCLVLAAAFYHVKILMAVFALAAVVLPWAAVIVANDRPARRALAVNIFRRRPASRSMPQADRGELPPAPRDSRIVDPDQ
jgi:DUF3099 family protein